MRKDIAAQQSSSSVGRQDTSEFISIFGGINRDDDGEGDGEGGGDDSEKEMNEDERDILKQFEDNDKELESIAALIVGSLDELKGKAQNIESSVKRQSDLLKKAKKAADENEAKLKQQNNQLKQVLLKYKNGRQMCLDLFLLLLFVALLGILLRMLKSKGYL